MMRRLGCICQGRVLFSLTILSLLTAAGPACGGDPPSTPRLTPAGAIVLDTGQKITVSAESAAAEKFDWRLQGPGHLTESTGATALYTAPEAAGELALITVRAENQHGASGEASLTVTIGAGCSIDLMNVAIPAAFMAGSGSPANHLALSRGNCAERPECTRFDFRPGARWAGILWWPPACGGSGTAAAFQNARDGRCALNLLAGNCSAGIQRVRFWARGETGGERIEFKVGAGDILPMPPRTTVVALTPEWTRYEIDLRGADLRRTVALFTWVAADDFNPEGVTFYLDQVRFEGHR